MNREDVVTLAATGDYGRPRPAVIVQTDALHATHAKDCGDQVRYGLASFGWFDTPSFLPLDHAEDSSLENHGVPRHD